MSEMETVYIVFGNGEAIESPTKLLSVWGDESDAESAAEDAEDEWYNTFIKEEVVRGSESENRSQRDGE